MYISTWNDFAKAAEDLYLSSPDTARYVHTFRRGDGKLILKVTDDRTAIKYKLTEAKDLNKFIELNSRLMTMMQNTMTDSNETDAIPMDITPSNAPAETTQPATPSDSQPSTPNVSKGSKNKKNKNKKRS